MARRRFASKGRFRPSETHKFPWDEWYRHSLGEFAALHIAWKVGEGETRKKMQSLAAWHRERAEQEAHTLNQANPGWRDEPSVPTSFGVVLGKFLKPA